MNMMLPAAMLLQKWCHEAVAEHGPDWPKIEKYVRDKLATLDTNEQANLASQISLLIAGKDDFIASPH